MTLLGFRIARGAFRWGVILSLFFGTACGPTGSAVRTGALRAATSPDTVVVFLEPPPHPYDVVGLVTAESLDGMTQQSDTQQAIDELRRQAAGLGANGVIVTRSHTGSTAQVGVVGTMPIVSGHNSQARFEGTAIHIGGQSR